MGEGKGEDFEGEWGVMRFFGFCICDWEWIEGSKESNGSRVDFIRDVVCLWLVWVWRWGELRLIWEFEGDGGVDEFDDECEYFLLL